MKREHLAALSSGLALSILCASAAGNAYIVGSTTCSDFPTQGPVQPTYGPGGDAFITKLAPSGSALVYSTFLSGATTAIPRAHSSQNFTCRTTAAHRARACSQGIPFP